MDALLAPQLIVAMLNAPLIGIGPNRKVLHAIPMRPLCRMAQQDNLRTLRRTHTLHNRHHSTPSKGDRSQRA